MGQAIESHHTGKRTDDRGLIDTYPNREEGLRTAMTIGSVAALESGDLVVIKACLGASKCKPGTDTSTCHFCETIECHPSGEVRIFKPGSH